MSLYIPDLFELVPLYKADGSHVWGEQPSLRNVKETTVKTGLEHVERMEALVRRMAVNAVNNGFDSEFQSEAREIVAELDKGSLPDEETKMVREVLLQMHEWFSLASDPNYKEIIQNINNGVWDNSTPGTQIRAAIAKGRELERLERQLIVENCHPSAIDVKVDGYHIKIDLKPIKAGELRRAR